MRTIWEYIAAYGFTNEEERAVVFPDFRALEEAIDVAAEKRDPGEGLRVRRLLVNEYAIAFYYYLSILNKCNKSHNSNLHNELTS